LLRGSGRRVAIGYAASSGALGVARGKQLGHCAQGFTAAGNSRTNCPDWKICDRRGFLVSHVRQSDEQDYRALLVGQFSQGLFEIAKLSRMV
jgi:hypothetical protein